MKFSKNVGEKHDHRWFVTTTKKEFEPVDPNLVDGRLDFYVMVEYAYLMCACTTVKKVVVKSDMEVDDDRA